MTHLDKEAIKRDVVQCLESVSVDFAYISQFN